MVLTPFWLSGCATGPAGVNVPGLQQILEAGFTAKGGRDKIAVHEVIRTQDSFLLTKVGLGNLVRDYRNAGFTFVKDADEFKRDFYWGGIVISDTLCTNTAIEFTQSPGDAVRKVRAGDLVLVDTRRADLQYSEQGGRGTPERLAAYRADKWMGVVILKVLCPSSDNECKRQYVYGLYDKQTGRPLPGYGRDRCPGFTKSCRD